MAEDLFEVRARYPKVMENNKVKNVMEGYIVAAMSFSEAEARATEALKDLGAFSLKAVKQTKIAEIFRSETADESMWYLAKVVFITLDEKTAVEKKSITQILVNAENFDEAVANLKEGMKGTVSDWEIASVQETKIYGVFTQNDTKIG